jgi:hypothetical protein
MARILTPEARRTESSAHRVWLRGWEGVWSFSVRAGGAEEDEGEGALRWIAARMRWVIDVLGVVRRGRIEIGWPAGVGWVW